MLLTAMFMASCYWPPVSLDTPLSKPWSDNITTFGEALLSRIPDLPADLVPASIPIVDRCWCELSMGFFEPFNSTRWEWNSVERTKEMMVRRMAARSTNDTLPAAAERKESVEAKSNATSGFSMLSNAVSTFSAVQRKLGLSKGLDLAANSTATPALHTPPPIILLSQAENDTSHGSLWGEYDLRPYGFDMIVDLSWPRSP